MCVCVCVCGGGKDWIRIVYNFLSARVLNFFDPNPLVMETLYNQPVVVDNGSGNLKAGFAGDDKPRTYASAVVGRPKYQKLMAGSLLASSTGIDS